MLLDCKGKSDIGNKRQTNQDYFIIEEMSDNCILMVVCDGMGGVVGGSEASSIAASVFAEYVKTNIRDGVCRSQILIDAQKKANDAVCDKSEKDSELEGMGTTLAAALYENGKYNCLWVGDSRIYAITNNGIKQLSHDHSFVQTLIDSGNLTNEEAKSHPNRNIITKAIGTERGLVGDICEISDEGLDGILLCSDGLCGYVEEEQMANICLSYQSAQDCSEKLVSAANDAGGYDNITVIIHKKS